MKHTLRRLLFFSLALVVFLLLVQPVVFAQRTPHSYHSDPDPLPGSADRDRLISLYNATGGDSWTDKSGWKAAPTLADGFNSDPCAEPFWFGVACEGDNILWLTLSSNQLTGEMPAELGALSQLTYLDLSGNQLTGEIPPELGTLSNLESIYLSSNQLTGEIPLELGNLSNLETLSIWANQLTGEIPSELGALS